LPRPWGGIQHQIPPPGKKAQLPVLAGKCNRDVHSGAIIILDHYSRFRDTDNMRTNLPPAIAPEVAS
jgi:hypothetical protein